DLAEAERLLGRPHRVSGTVVRGDGRGRALGFPTANLEFDYRPCLPPDGIYLARCASPGGTPHGQPALASIGTRPTFHAGGPTVVEAYLLDWAGDLYGAALRLELLEHLRGQERFADAQALVGQMRADEARARTWFASVSEVG
ncbi:MAG: riboflavin kinase, partial [Candidatus Limnocylindria bacterium]